MSLKLHYSENLRIWIETKESFCSKYKSKLVDLPRIQTPSFFSMPKVYADAETNLTPSNAEISIGDANSENSPCWGINGQ